MSGLETAYGSQRPGCLQAAVSAHKLGITRLLAIGSMAKSTLVVIDIFALGNRSLARGQVCAVR